MIAAVHAWGELVKAGFGLVQTGLRTNEMMLASASVIGSRVGTMAAAARDPLAGDYVELGQMVPEKVTAFSEAGNALTQHYAELLLHTSEHVRHVASRLFGGRLLTAADVSDLAARTTSHITTIVTNTMNIGSVALAPIHGRATANALRLARRD